MSQKVWEDYFRNQTDVHHTIILSGPRGQGKLALATHIANCIDGDYTLVKELKIDNIRSIIENSRTLSTRRVYILPNAEDMNMNAQNALLKMAEEPNRNAYLILLTENPDKLLPTIRSRAEAYRLLPYTRTELLQYTDNEILLGVCKNPMQIGELRAMPYGDMYKLCEMIVENIEIVSAANVFNITKRMKEYDLEYFLEMLDYTYGKKIVEARNNGLKDVKRLLSLKRQLGILRKYTNRLYSVKSINMINSLDIMFLEMRGE